MFDLDARTEQAIITTTTVVLGGLALVVQVARWLNHQASPQKPKPAPYRLPSLPK